MDENIFQIAGRIAQLYQEAYETAYETYLPLVDNVRNRKVSEDELSHLLDNLLDFACEEKILVLFKRVCRRYFYVYPSCIKLYIKVYREMWKDGGNV